MSETKEKAGKLKVKKPKNLAKSDEPIKVDLSKPVEKTEEKIETQQDAIQVGETKEIPDDKSSGDIPKVEIKGGESDKESAPVVESKEEETPVIEEIVEEPVKEEEVVEIGDKMETQDKPEAVISQDVPKENIPTLPENIVKVVDFMNETGGTLEDYVRLNHDYSNVDNDTLLREYYSQTKSHLDSEEINFLIEDNFSWDEDVDEPREVRKAKLAYKEEVAKAKQHLEGLKSKYYEEIKLNPGITPEQQDAMNFFNRYNEEQQVAQKQHETFKSNTKDYFGPEFKGFDFSIGEKKFRYGIKNVNDVADKQSNITNTIKKFLDKEGNVQDVKGYHKAIYAAEHADTIAQHFYEQGKADAIKDLSAQSKNINTEPRTSNPGDVFVGGLKVKSISGMDSSKLKIKTRKFN
tara:strand:- start:2253 stop:3473 length:1221 start_codon:yes stop_codon:yes gene_type:complete